MRMREYMKVALAILLAVASSTHRASAIGLNEEDVYTWPSPPSDLPRPANAVTAWVTNNGNTVTYGSGVVVQPNWILTAGHVYSDVVNARVEVDGEEYKIVEVHRHEDYPAVELKLLKIEKYNEDPADLEDYVGIMPPFVGMEVTMGGYGKTYTNYTTTPWTQGGEGTLRWGRNVLATKASQDRWFASFSPVEEEDYIKYEYGLLDKDSGAGALYDGLVWNVSGLATGLGLLGELIHQPITPDHVDWIIDTINDNGGDFQSPPLPAADNNWDWSSGPDDWSVSGNWTGGVPDSTEVVVMAIDDTWCSIESGTAEAKSLFLGGESAYMDIGMSGGTLTIEETLCLGPGHGQFTLSGGSLTTPELYVGSDTVSTFRHHGGTNTIDRLLCLGVDDGSEGRYNVVGNTGTLVLDISDGTMILGMKSGSYGYMNSYMNTYTSELSVARAIVGLAGDGRVNQSSSSTDFTFGLLAIGYHDGSAGTYTQSAGDTEVGTLTLSVMSGSAGTYVLSGGQLDAETVDILRDSAVFVQSGGTHNIDVLKTSDASGYVLSGGTLNLLEGGLIRGDMDFDSGSGSLVCSNITDLSTVTISDADSATMTVTTDSLLILPTGFDTENDLGTLVENGIAYNAGSTLVIPNGKSIVGNGAINDHVQISGTGEIEATGSIHLTAGITVSDDAAVDLGLGQLTVRLADSLLNLDTNALQANKVKIDDASYKLTACGQIVLEHHFIIEEGTLAIGPDVAELAVDCVSFDGGYGNTLEIDLGGTASGESDYLDLDSEYLVLLSIDFDVSFVDGYGDNALPPDEIEIINYGTASPNISFGTITHDGPAVLTLTAIDDTVNDVVKLKVGAWNPGDVTLDGFVGGDDLDIILGNWEESGSGLTWADGDLDDDQYVGQDDLDIVNANWGQSME